jgi:outer membrane protein OmpA-like peptidoglycan-associated protein
MNMRNTHTLRYLAASAAVLFFLAAAPARSAEEGTQSTNIDQVKARIQALFQSIMEKNTSAQALFMEAKIKADSLKQQAADKLAYLDETLQKARRTKVIGQADLDAATALQKEALALNDQFLYPSVLDKVREALGHISSVPVVSIAVAPQLFVPDEGVLTVTPDVFSINAVTSWTLSVRKKEEGEKDSVEIMKWTGASAPTNAVAWDGRVGKTVAVDSASSYVVELVVYDDKAGSGRSGPVRFKTDIFTTSTPRGLLINISSIKFDYNKADLKPAFQALVKRVFNFLLEYPGYNIVVEGHSDHTGVAPDNQVLSEKRANSVADFLVQLGMDRSRIKVYGLGEALPSATERLKAALNRRVSFILLKNADDIRVYEDFIGKLDLKKETDAEMK